MLLRNLSEIEQPSSDWSTLIVNNKKSTTLWPGCIKRS
jgi:hypothetical protein